MKQVQIWIAICPFEKKWNENLKVQEVQYRVHWEPQTESYILAAKIMDIVESKLDSRLWLREGESYETIKQALWKYQKSLLPSQFYHHKNLGRIEFSTGEYFRVEFYNPKTNIITITEFD